MSTYARLPMDAQQSGRIGGRATSSRYGSEHMRKIGRRGGRATKKRGPEFYRKIGQRGGETTRRLVEKAKRTP